MTNILSHLFSADQYLRINLFGFFQLTQIKQHPAISMLCLENIFVFRSQSMGICSESTVVHASGIIPFVLIEQGRERTYMIVHGDVRMIENVMMIRIVENVM